MAEAEINRRRHRHHVAQTIALLEGGDLDPGDPALAARIAERLADWTRHNSGISQPAGAAFGG